MASFNGFYGEAPYYQRHSIDHWIFWAFIRISIMILGACTVVIINPAWYWKLFWAIVLTNIGFFKSYYYDL